MKMQHNKMFIVDSCLDSQPLAFIFHVMVFICETYSHGCEHHSGSQQGGV